MMEAKNDQSATKTDFSGFSFEWEKNLRGRWNDVNLFTLEQMRPEQESK